MSLYTPVKYALMIILIVGIVLTVLNLFPELQRSRADTQKVLLFVAQLVVLLIGFFGAYRNNRQLLLTFAIILTVLVIVSLARSTVIEVVGNAVLDIVSIVLSVYQAHMISTGDTI